MAPMSSRKRKRVSNESPMVLIEGDTIAVTPLRAARTRTSEQIPLSESHMGGYAARSARYTDSKLASMHAEAASDGRPYVT
jgi:hypothetical protein